MKILVTLALGLAALPSLAAEYAGFLPNKSQVDFVSTQMNVPVNGRFGKFEGQIRFDPAKPAEGQARLEVVLASIETGLDEANAEVAGADWFDVAKHPKAIFESTAVESLGNQMFRIQGKLTIRGTTQPVTTEARFTEQGGAGIFAGSFKMNRKDFGVGQGIWGDTSVVANEVEIRYQLAAPAR